MILADYSEGEHDDDNFTATVKKVLYKIGRSSAVAAKQTCSIDGFMYCFMADGDKSYLVVSEQESDGTKVAAFEFLTSL